MRISLAKRRAVARKAARTRARNKVKRKAVARKASRKRARKKTTAKRAIIKKSPL